MRISTPSIRQIQNISLLGFLLLLSFLFTIQGCRKKKGDCNNGKQVFQQVAEPKGYNIWLGDHTVEEFIAEVQAKAGVTINPETQLRKCPCGDNIINVDYPGLVFEGHGPVKVRQPGGEGGELSSGIEFAKNLVFTRDEEDIDKFIRQDSSTIRKDMKTLETRINQASGNIVKIAILDSGIDSTTTLNYIGVSPTSDAACITQQYLINGRPVPAKVRGFNLAPLDEGSTSTPDILNIHDTHPYQHGTRVAYIAARQFKDAPKNLNMLIMRVLNNQNKGDSFGIICAMITAKKLGAQIINMSLGYYGEKDAVFESAIKTLNDNPAKPVWIVMAAGNYRRGLDTLDDHTLAQNRDLGLRAASKRFFPASFNDNEDNHMFTATTTFEPLDKICIGQNYGKGFVDLAVKTADCNVPAGIPSNGSNPASQQGTSFAAPVVAGWLGTQPDLSLPKVQILTTTAPAPSLDPFIRNGRYISPK